jgi:nucleotide-binding universal stress UspA family protein
MVIVMSGHGHRRMREVFFGGCTQSVLEASDRPIFSHALIVMYDATRC